MLLVSKGVEGRECRQRRERRERSSVVTRAIVPIQNISQSLFNLTIYIYSFFYLFFFLFLFFFFSSSFFKGSSTNKYVQNLFPEAKKSVSKKRPKTAGSQFKQSMADLVTTLMACTPHYIRCIKPNDQKRGGLYNQG